MFKGIGSSVYNDQNYDTVYGNEERAHDFASWISGDSMEPKYQNGSVAPIFVGQDLIMMEQFMQ